MDFSFLHTYYPYFLQGTVVTLFISVVVVLFGSIIGVVMALMKLSKLAPLRWIANIYIEILRGTPLFLQILIGFLVLQGVFPIPAITIMQVDMSRLVPGLIPLALNSGAYVAEIVRGGIQAVNKGQLEAAYSLGLRPKLAMQYVILPQAIRNILPALGNEFITIIKDSSLLSTIGIAELLYGAQAVQTISYKGLEPLLVAAVIYFIMTFIASRLLGLWERKMGKGYRR